MNKFAVAYIRARKYGKNWARDAKEQRRQLEQYAETKDIEIRKWVYEEQKFSLVNDTGFQLWQQSCKYCKKNKHDILFVEIGRWRRNIIINQYLEQQAKDKKAGKHLQYKKIPVAADLQTIEAIELHARQLKYDQRYSTGKHVLRKKEGAKDRVLEWQTSNKVGTKRLNNFKHLTHGVKPIYEKINKHRDKLTPRLIAENLNIGLYLTVDGKRWNRDNTRKAMDLIDTPLFQDFLRVLDEIQKRVKPAKNLT